MNQIRFQYIYSSSVVVACAICVVLALSSVRNAPHGIDLSGPIVIIAPIFLIANFWSLASALNRRHRLAGVAALTTLLVWIPIWFMDSLWWFGDSNDPCEGRVPFSFILTDALEWFALFGAIGTLIAAALVARQLHPVVFPKTGERLGCGSDHRGKNGHEPLKEP